MNASDLLKPGAVVLGITTVGALGFAAGFIVARDPQVLRRVARALAGGVERVAGALAESREELADLWAEVREDARQDIEAQTFSAAPAVSATEASEKPELKEAEQPSPRTVPKRRSTRRRASSSAAGGKPH
jgi:hypothetical protein